MTSGLYFLKLELNYLKDSTFNKKLTDAQKWRYIQLYMLAKDLNAGGSFISHGKELDLSDIAYHLHMDDDQLQADMDAIQGLGLISMNGHGPYLVRFVQEQETPRTDAERKADQRERDRSQGSHEPVTVLVIESESESESESDIESESEEESSVSGSAQRTTDDDRSLTDQKRRICSQAGIPPKYSSTILTNPEISPNDILEIGRAHV